jgi:methyl-accepting chemotaxis protein
MGKPTLRNLSIGLKVSLPTAVALIGLMLVAAGGWFGSRQLAGELKGVGDEGVQRLVAAQTLDTQVTDLNQRLFKSLTWEATGQRTNLIKALDDKLLADLGTFDKRLREAVTAAPDGQRASAQALAKAYSAYAKSVADTLDMKTAGVANATSFVATLDDQYAKLHALLGEMVKSEVAGTHARVVAAEASVIERGLLTAGVALVALAISAFLSWTFMRAIVRPLGRAAELATALADGDLSVRHSTRGADATGHVLSALDHVARNLTALVAEIRHTAERIDTASGEIASGNSDLSTRTESTASSLQEAAASIEQLAATVRNSADNAQAANALAREASGVAREGGTIVADVVQTMDRINTQAKKIGEIIGTIDGIAFQTNILALNAAVEAARAGEQGRGFAVVASEVRLLAQRSSEAAREIRALIGSSVEQIDAGVGTVKAAGQTMDRIVGAIEKVSAQVDDIARAAAEQASGIAQVNQTVAEMERSTQQNAAMVEQASAATESLRGQSQHLAKLLTRFRTS